MIYLSACSNAVHARHPFSKAFQTLSHEFRRKIYDFYFDIHYSCSICFINTLSISCFHVPCFNPKSKTVNIRTTFISCLQLKSLTTV